MNTNPERRAYAHCEECGGTLDRVVTFAKIHDLSLRIVVDLCAQATCLEAQRAKRPDAIVIDDGLGS